jgi:hypothetical protein
MAELAEKRYLWQDRDDSFFVAAEEEFYSEKDQISDRDINYNIKGSSVYLQAEAGQIAIGGIATVTLTPTSEATFRFISQPSAYDICGGGAIRFMEGKHETCLYHTEWQPMISDSEGYSIELKLNEPTYPSNEDLVKWKNFGESLKTLQEVYKEHSVENWDGYGAKSISIDTYSETTRLLMMLPASIPLPDIISEPGGEIALEWYKMPKYVFLISLSGNNIISYAGLFGKNNRIYGSENFGDHIPNVIIDSIHRLFPND